jgi:uncharacterized protein
MKASPGSAENGRVRCPVCSKDAGARYRPFCSRRCADIDLGRWLKGTYAIPVKRDEEAEDGDGEDDARRA